MPKTLRLGDGGYMRRLDVQSIVQYLYAMQCVQIVGFSNIGKSALLRLLSQDDVWTQELGEAGHDYLAVYIDCNRMLGMSDQGFYELVLRCLQESCEEFATLPALTSAYERLVAPASEFQIPLAFNQGLTAALQSSTDKIVLLFDEFDEPFSQIDSRVFLNMRALRDRYNSKLAYVTATVQRLRGQGTDHHSTEFCELFAQHAWYLAPLTHSDVERFIRNYAEAFEVDFTPADADFIYGWAGGHPTMLAGVCEIMRQVIEGAGEGSGDGQEHVALHRQAARRFRTDENLTLECIKIWNGCSEAEQGELLALTQADYVPDASVVSGLMRRYLLLKVEGRYQPFCKILAEFVQRKTIQTRGESTTLWVDIDSGEVLVGEQPVETLTNLEYRLMLLLFRNAEKIVDKYQIVADVWGENYIDEVDDSRIEKLVSRLRQKIEPDPTAMRFLTTVRGRGYRLVLNGEG